MTIQLYKNFSEANVVDKNLSHLTTLIGNLREGTSVLSPSIRLETDETIQNVNYIYIEEFSRFYFVGDIVCVRNNIWDLTCHVDVLSTYKNQLRELGAIIARQEFSYNLYLEDDKMLTTSRRVYTTRAFPNRVSAAGAGGSSFILTCAGG